MKMLVCNLISLVSLESSHWIAICTELLLITIKCFVLGNFDDFASKCKPNSAHRMKKKLVALIFVTLSLIVEGN